MSSVKHLKIIKYIVPLAALILMFAHCGKKPAAVDRDTRVVATVDGYPLTDNIFIQRLARYPEKHPQDVLYDWIQEEVLLTAARKLELDRDPALQQRMEQAANQVLISELIKSFSADVDEPAERKVRRYYDLNYHSFRVVRPMARGRVYLHTSEDTLAMARDSLLRGARFDRIRQLYPTVQQHDTGYRYREEFPEAFAEFLFDSTTDVSAVRKGAGLFELINRTHPVREPSHHFTYSEVKKQIAAQLMSKAAKKRELGSMQEIQESAKVKVDSLLVETILDSLWNSGKLPALNPDSAQETANE